MVASDTQRDFCQNKAIRQNKPKLLDRGESFSVLRRFENYPVVDFRPSSGLSRDVTFRIRPENRGKFPFSFSGSEDISSIERLVIGPWGHSDDPKVTSAVLRSLIETSLHLKNLKSLFFGDIDGETCPLSRLSSVDIRVLFDAFPELSSLHLRGGQGLIGHQLDHNHLKTLVIQSAGIPRETVRALVDAKLPALEHLELWLGSPEYGGDSTIDDLSLSKILRGHFPKLRYLGLKNTHLTNQIAYQLRKLKISKSLRTLDLAHGTLTTSAFRGLATINFTKLKRLDLTGNYLTKNVTFAWKAGFINGLGQKGTIVFGSQRSGTKRTIRFF